MPQIKAIIFDWVGTLYERNKGVFPYSERVLQELKRKYKLGLISIASKGIEARRAELDASGIMYHFNCVIVDGTKTAKQFLDCMKQMRTMPEETAIVDDRTVRGIKIGNQLGCETYWVCKGDYANETPNEETGQPTYKIDSIEELLDYL